MKKRLFLLSICLAGICLLAGCGGAATAAVGVAPPEDALQHPEVMSSSSVLTAPLMAGLTFSLGQDVIAHESQTEDGVKLTSTHLELPVLQCFRKDGQEVTEALTAVEEQALLVVNTFNANFDVWREQNPDVTQAALEDYQIRPEMFARYGMYYQDTLTFSSYTTDHLVSILAVSYSYYGGAHPNTAFMTWNFDLDDGTFFSPSAIAVDEPEFEKAVTEALIRQARLASDDVANDYWEDYEEILADWPSYAVSFDQTGMTVSFSPYELGCYASGNHIFTLSNTFLEPYLSDYGRALLGLNETAQK